MSSAETADTGHRPEIVVITGMSGAGRSTAVHTFEDRGYFCIDNLPPAMIRSLVDLVSVPGSRVEKVAVACDIRGLAFFDELLETLDDLEERGYSLRLLYLEADDAVLVRRFKETRRPHPIEDAPGVAEAITMERETLCDVRGRADLVIDTSRIRPQQLRDLIRKEFLRESLRETLSINVASFGFKYGVPLDADILMDVRFIPNPFYDPDLRELSGLEEPVREFVLSQEQTEVFLSHWAEMLAAIAPKYLAEGKAYLSIAMGCTGGMHRSVVLAEETASALRARGFHVSVNHRDIARDQAAR